MDGSAGGPLEPPSYRAKDGGDKPDAERPVSPPGLAAAAADSQSQGLSLGRWLVVFFISIATILGTGILALPVKLSSCGFAPFTFSFSISFVAQSLGVCLMVELLQRAAVQNQREQQIRRLQAESVVDPTIPHAEPNEHASGPSLHRLASLYLRSAGARALFIFCALLHFTSLLIGYGLAWSKAFCQLAHCKPVVVVTPFVIVASTVLLIWARQLQPLVSTLTLIKCVMLIVMVAVVAYLGSVEGDVHDDDYWPALGQPFLIGTIALGGVVNVMPVLFEDVPLQRRAISQFRVAVLSGVAACFVLNMLWAHYVLQVVPQTSPQPCFQDADNGTITLACANSHDEIATQPVVDVIRESHQSLIWLASLVASFILLSITVSYLTMGNALKHLLDGFVSAQQQARGLVARIVSNERALRIGIYVLVFGFILLIAQLNPNSFLLVLEIFTSLSLNMEGGFFVGYMFHISRSGKVGAVDEIPLPFGAGATWAWIFTCIFFGFAVLYDIVTATMHFWGKKAASIALPILAVGGLLTWLGYGLLYRRNWQMSGVRYMDLKALDDSGDGEHQMLPWEAENGQFSDGADSDAHAGFWRGPSRHGSQRPDGDLREKFAIDDGEFEEETDLGLALPRR